MKPPALLRMTLKDKFLDFKLSTRVYYPFFAVCLQIKQKAPYFHEFSGDFHGLRLMSYECRVEKAAFFPPASSIFCKCHCKQQYIVANVSAQASPFGKLASTPRGTKQTFLFRRIEIVCKRKTCYREGLYCILHHASASKV